MEVNIGDGSKIFINTKQIIAIEQQYSFEEDIMLIKLNKAVFEEITIQLPDTPPPQGAAPEEVPSEEAAPEETAPEETPQELEKRSTPPLMMYCTSPPEKNIEIKGWGDNGEEWGIKMLFFAFQMTGSLYGGSQSLLVKIYRS